MKLDVEEFYENMSAHSSFVCLKLSDNDSHFTGRNAYGIDWWECPGYLGYQDYEGNPHPTRQSWGMCHGIITQLERCKTPCLCKGH
jgi:hypothetical protein